MQPTRKRKSGQLSEQPEGVRASLFGLAPDGVYQAIPVTRDTGELLPHLFTLTLNRFAPTQGGLISAALSLGLPPVAVSDHPALRSPDFPPQHSMALQRSFCLLRSHIYYCVSFRSGCQLRRHPQYPYQSTNSGKVELFDFLAFFCYSSALNKLIIWQWHY